MVCPNENTAARFNYLETGPFNFEKSGVPLKMPNVA